MNATARQTDEYLTSQEAAAILRVHSSTISRYVSTGMLTGVKIGSKLLIPSSALDDLIQRSTQAAAPSPANAKPRAPRPVPEDRQRLRDEFPHLKR